MRIHVLIKSMTLVLIFCDPERSGEFTCIPVSKEMHRANGTDCFAMVAFANRYPK